MKLLYFVFSLGFVACHGVANDQSDIGHWAVGDCMLAEFAMQVNVPSNVSIPGSQNVSIAVPSDAKVDGTEKNCLNDTQTLSLSWHDTASNDSSVSLSRNVQVTFKKAVNSSMYGVHSVYALFQVGKFQYNGTTHSSSLDMLWQGKDEVMMFLTPLDRSFLCSNVGTVVLKTSLRYDIKKAAPINLLNGTTLTAEHVQFDAFRPAQLVPAGFRTPMDCDYKPNDIIPIAVGVALAGLVVAVLVAYMIGRRRNRQRGYQSV